MKKITDSVFYIGVDDHKTDLFERQFSVPNGMSYNSYLIIDEKIAVFDTVEINFIHQWLDNLAAALAGRTPDYLIVQHMEPDHSAGILSFLSVYPDAKIVGNAKTFTMMEQFYGLDFEKNKLSVSDGESLSLGKRSLKFVYAPMVHWPEVMMTYDSLDKILFSADGFGKFGALDTEEEWDCEARRYYFGIVAKYGAQVQALLKKISAFEIEKICSLHGPVLTENLSHYLNLYNIWSSYGVESEGIVIAYTSVYGNTKKAVMLLAEKLKAKGCPKVVINDLTSCDMAEAVEDAFRYGKLVLATTTYNTGIFPKMRDFIDRLTERGYRNRAVALMENGSWAPAAAKTMKEMLSGCKDISFYNTEVTIKSALNKDSADRLEALAQELCEEYKAANPGAGDNYNLRALFNIGYGLYVLTSNDGVKDNGLIVNAVSQVTNSPNRIIVAVNKESYSHHVIKNTGIMNLNCLSVDAPFAVFQNFGFRSGRAADKFENLTPLRSENGLAVLPEYINSYMSLKVVEYIDLATHGMFICEVTQAKVINKLETMTYNFYQSNVKPKPKTEGKKGYVCKICGYVYEGDVLPEDFICPICKHGAADFEKIQ